VLVAAGVGAEVDASPPVRDRDGAIGDDERAAHGIADHRHAALRHWAAAAAARRTLDDAGEQPPESAADEEGQGGRERQTEQHTDPGLRAPPPDAGWADCTLSSARFAACASGLPGATSITFCHAWIAPSRSCLPNARTMPRFNSVLACFGSISSECANCSS